MSIDRAWKIGGIGIDNLLITNRGEWYNWAGMVSSVRLISQGDLENYFAFGLADDGFHTREACVGGRLRVR